MKRGRKILLTLGAALGVAILIPCLYHWHLQAVNEAYIAKLIAQGEPMTLAQVLPPPVPPAENSADKFLAAVTLLEGDSSLLRTNYYIDAMLAVGPGQAVVCSQLPKAVGSDFTNSWTELAAAAGQNDEALKLLLQITEHPALDFHINYLHGMGDSMLFTNLHLIEMKKSGRYLGAAAMVALHNGDLAGAVNDQRAVLALIHATQSQRFVISELVRIAMLGNAEGVTWEILQTPDLTDSELAGMQSDWERLNFIQASRDALLVQRVSGELILNKWRKSPAKLREHFAMAQKAREALGAPDEHDSFMGHVGTTTKIFLWQNWWSYPDDLLSLRGYSVVLGTSRFLATNESFLIAIKTQQAQLEPLQITNIPDDILSLTFSLVANPDLDRKSVV